MWHRVIVLELFSLFLSSLFSLSLSKSYWGQVWDGDKKETETFGMTCREANYKGENRHELQGSKLQGGKVLFELFLWFPETNTLEMKSYSFWTTFCLIRESFAQTLLPSLFPYPLFLLSLFPFLPLRFFPFVSVSFTLSTETPTFVWPLDKNYYKCVATRVSMMLRWREEEEKEIEEGNWRKKGVNVEISSNEKEGEREKKVVKRERERIGRGKKKLELRKRVSLAIIQVSPSYFSLWCLPDPSLPLSLSPLYFFQFSISPSLFIFQFSFCLSLSRSLLNSFLFPSPLKLVSHSSALLVFFSLFRIWTWLVSCYKGSSFD